MSCGSTVVLIVSITVSVTNGSYRSKLHPTGRGSRGGDELTSHLLTLMLIGNVVLSFGVD